MTARTLVRLAGSFDRWTRNVTLRHAIWAFVTGYALRTRVSNRFQKPMMSYLGTNPRRHSVVLVAVLGILVGFGGCGSGAYRGPVYPVKGKVLLASGKPLTSGAVQFIPESGGMLASGKIGPDGTFSLVSLDKREGAAPGPYKVRIEPSLEMTAPRGKSARTPLPFATKYTDDDGETGLTATVKTEPTELEPFRLDTK